MNLGLVDVHGLFQDRKRGLGSMQSGQVIGSFPNELERGEYYSLTSVAEEDLTPMLRVPPDLAVSGPLPWPIASSRFALEGLIEDSTVDLVRELHSQPSSEYK